jgi:hypothetical protein
MVAASIFDVMTKCKSVNSATKSKLDTATEVIDALGGTQAVADAFRLSYRVVWNWRVRGLPSDTYAVMQNALAKRRLAASDALWQQRDADFSA